MKLIKSHAIVLLIILCLAGFACASGTLQVTVDPNPFEQGKSTTFKVTTNYAASSLKLRIYKNSTRVFSDRFSSYTYVWGGQDYKGDLLAPGTYTYEVVAGCGCKALKATGTVTIIAPSTTPTPTPTPGPTPSPGTTTATVTVSPSSTTNCPDSSVKITISTGSEKFRRWYYKILDSSGSIVAQDSAKTGAVIWKNKYSFNWTPKNIAPGTYTVKAGAKKCYGLTPFNTCPSGWHTVEGTTTLTITSCGTGTGPTPTPTPTPSEGTMSRTAFVQAVAQGGAINYSAVPVCGSSVYNRWCKASNLGAIVYRASSDSGIIEIYIYYSKGQCQNPPQAPYVGCTTCVLFLKALWQTNEIPKSIANAAISALRAYQGGGVGPTPTPTPTPRTTMTLGQFFQAIYGCNLPENIREPMPYRGCDVSNGEWVNPALRQNVICYSKRHGGAKWKIIIQISGTVDGVECSKNIDNVSLVTCMKFKKKVGLGLWQNVTEIPVEVGNDAASKLRVYCQALTRTPTPSPTTGEVQVSVTPNPFEQGKSTTFTVSGTGVTQIRVKIYNLTGKEVFDSDWVSGNSYTWNGVANKGSLAGKQLARGAYIYVIYVKVGSETQGPYRGYVYIVAPGETVPPILQLHQPRR
jgi:flagellar hook assembly protein FlgD